MFEGLKAIREEIENATITNPDHDEIRDGYQLRFVGKDYAKFVSTLPTETVLIPDTEWNNKAENKDSQNIFITGDNLDALKHLVNAYERQIKCIYIDPPYNTGSDGFVYNDTFNFTDAQLKEKLGMTDSDVARLRALNGKCSHSAWLTFMLPRLILAKRLLSDDGVMFISIDDNEQANLKMICDEVFGESNFHVCFPRVTKKGGKSSDTTAKNHDYVLMYKKTSYADIVGVEHNDDSYCNKDEFFDERGYYKLNQTLDYDSLGWVRSLDYPIEIEGEVFYAGGSKEEYKKRQEGQHGRADWGWRWSVDLFDFGVKNGFIEVKRGGVRPRIYTKTYQNVKIEKINNSYKIVKIDRTKPLSTLEFTDNKYSNDSATKVIAELLGKGVFEYTKAPELISSLMKLVAGNDFTILDFFAGSATTAQAVMQLNKDDGGNRKYIMVQLNEAVKPGSEAENQGFKTIDEISRKRIKLAAEQIGDTSGFKHYKLAKVTDDLILDKIDEFDPTKPNLLSDDMVSPFSGDALGTGLKASGLDTILTTWMVDDGYTLTKPVQGINFSSYIAYSPKDSHRLYLISAGWTTNNTRELLNLIGRNELSVQTIIVYNHSFDFKTLTELKNNMKSVLEGNVEIIERF